MSSAFSRVFSAGSAGTARLGLLVCFQILATPVFLRVWNASEYGAFIFFVALTSIIQSFDGGHASYLEAEFIRIGLRRRRVLESLLAPGILGTFILNLLQIISVTCLVIFAPSVIGLNTGNSVDGLPGDMQLIILISSMVWSLGGTWACILGRYVTPYGYYARCAWWGVLQFGLQSIIPLCVALLGYGVAGACYAYIFSTWLVALLASLDFWRILRKERVHRPRYRYSAALYNIARSSLVIVKGLLEAGRNQGFRIVLGTTGGTASVAMFSTIRTIGNIGTQGIGVVVAPLTPELMRVALERDRAKVQAAITAMWTPVVILLIPLSVYSFPFMPKLFALWTNEKLVLDQWLYLTLILSAGVYGVYQPAIALVVSNNFLTYQLASQLFGFVVMILMLVVAYDRIGIAGAGLAILCAELLVSFLMVRKAKSWLATRKLDWPQQTYVLILSQVAFAAFGMILLLWFPQYMERTLLLYTLAMALGLWITLSRLEPCAREALMKPLRRIKLIRHQP